MKNRYRLLLTCIGILFSLLSYSQLKINSSGYVGINNDSPSYRLDVSGPVHFMDGYSYVGLTYDSGGLYPSYDNGIMLGLPYNQFSYINAYYGNFTNSVTAYTGCFWEIYNYSDKSLKTNIADLPSAGNRLFRLRPVKYNLIKEVKQPAGNKQAPQAPQTTQDTREHMGFIAQEVKEIFPELVAEDKDGKLGVNYIELIPVLVQALKDQNDKIKSLEDRIAKLENGSK